MGAEVSHPSLAHTLARFSFSFSTAAGRLHSALGGEML